MAQRLQQRAIVSRAGGKQSEQGGNPGKGSPWGRGLLVAAQGQKQLEDLARWMHQGLAGFPDYTEIFKALYGLENQEAESPDFLCLWQRAEEDFRRCFPGNI